MFEGLRARWRAAKERRFQERVGLYLRAHFTEVMGQDAKTFTRPGAVDSLHRKYFGG